MRHGPFDCESKRDGLPSLTPRHATTSRLSPSPKQKDTARQGWLLNTRKRYPFMRGRLSTTLPVSRHVDEAAAGCDLTDAIHNAFSREDFRAQPRPAIPNRSELAHTTVLRSPKDASHSRGCDIQLWVAAGAHACILHGRLSRNMACECILKVEAFLTTLPLCLCGTP